MIRPIPKETEYLTDKIIPWIVCDDETLTPYISDSAPDDVKKAYARLLSLI